MLGTHILRLVCAGLTPIAFFIGFALNRWKFKDEEFEIKKKHRYIKEIEGKTETLKEEVTATKKVLKKYERFICNVITYCSIYIFIGIGICQVWQLLDLSPVIGSIITIIVPFLPFGVIGGWIYGYKLQKNKTNNLAIFNMKKKEKRFSQKIIHFLIDENALMYVKPETLKEVMNEVFKYILTDVRRDIFWSGVFDGVICEIIFADELKFTDDTIEIKSYIRDGAIVIEEFLRSRSERDLNKKYTLLGVLADQENEIVVLEHQNSVLKAQKKKGLLDLSAKRIAHFFKQFERRAKIPQPDDLGTKKAIRKHIEEAGIKLGDEDE